MDQILVGGGGGGCWSLAVCSEHFEQEKKIIKVAVFLIGFGCIQATERC